MTVKINLIHVYFNKNEFISQYKPFTNLCYVVYSFLAVAKSAAEPRNSNDEQLANSSTPQERAFFIRRLHTPTDFAKSKFGLCFKINMLSLNGKTSHLKFEVCVKIKELTIKDDNKTQIGLVRFLSMVACNGKGFALCCVPIVAVFEPVTRYRPKASKLQAVASKKLQLEQIAMFTYIFSAIRRADFSDTTRTLNQLPKSTLHIQAESESQACARFAKDYFLIPKGRISLKNNLNLDRGLGGCK